VRAAGWLALLWPPTVVPPVAAGRGRATALLGTDVVAPGLLSHHPCYTAHTAHASATGSHGAVGQCAAMCAGPPRCGKSKACSKPDGRRMATITLFEGILCDNLYVLRISSRLELVAQRSGNSGGNSGGSYYLVDHNPELTVGSGPTGDFASSVCTVQMVCSCCGRGGDGLARRNNSSSACVRIPPTPPSALA
jgi:hypothetical protein